MTDDVTPGPVDPEAVDLDQLYRDQDPRTISLESRKKMVEQTGLTLEQINDFLAHIGKAWAEIDADDAEDDL